MKKALLIIAGLAALLAVSCTQEKLQNPAAGQEVEVSFEAAAADAIATKAYSDGTTATTLHYAVYTDNGTKTVYTGNEEFNNLKATVKLNLVTGITYDLVFWAQNDAAPYTFNAEAKTVTIDYANVNANDEKLDAFCKTVAGYTVSGPVNENVKLTRPFAQINVATSDTDVAAETGVTVEKSSMIVAEVYTTLNLMDGSVADVDKVSFAMNNIPAGELMIGGQAYDYMAMNYILVSADKATTGLNFSVKTNKHQIDYALSNVPVQRNYRTNIYGALLTNPTEWTVEIVPEFDGEAANIDYDLAKVLENGGTYTLQKDMEIQESLYVNALGKVVNINLNGHKIVNNSIAASGPAEGDADVFVVSEGTLNIYGPGTVEANYPGEDGYAMAVWARGPFAEINIYGGHFKNSQGDKSKKLDLIYASSGKVNIYGGTFESAAVEGQPWLLNLKDGSVGKINVYEGTFVNFNPADNLSENPKQSFVAKGSVVRQDGDNYVVEYQVASGVWQDEKDADTYYIESVDGMLWFADQVNSGANSFAGKTVILNKEIDLKGIDWQPIGKDGAQFEGTFDGQGYFINNLTVNNKDTSKNCASGLFGFNKVCHIKNVNLILPNVTGHHNVGCVSGYQYGTVSGCQVEAAVINCIAANDDANGDKCGAIVGYLGEDAKMEYCAVYGAQISAGRDAGVFVGAAKPACVVGCKLISGYTITVTANGTSTGANVRKAVIGREL